MDSTCPDQGPSAGPPAGRFAALSQSYAQAAPEGAGLLPHALELSVPAHAIGALLTGDTIVSPVRRAPINSEVGSTSGDEVVLMT